MRQCHLTLTAWNSKPEYVRAEPDIGVFRKLLKTLRNALDDDDDDVDDDDDDDG